MKKLVVFFLLAISTSLFAEELVLRNLYIHIPVEDEELDWEDTNKHDFVQLTDNVQADLSNRTIVIQFNELINEVWINVVDQITGEAIVEEFYAQIQKIYEIGLPKFYVMRLIPGMAITHILLEPYLHKQMKCKIKTKQDKLEISG